ncbi:hypothetical protein AVEN_202211-1 [Araneus ventricosus]|uniref:Uncharacterized protein n=1 Tax=Araneus ventricosus TaxID=182803 RepID=A0A4Y2P710_ARAVE|nr:hypothetical protein AVEN_192233-1 [Araneus ventricosus]GBN47214.1 hypothetical protein AVEN_202211-1 [Araneus ventricosus]
MAKSVINVEQKSVRIGVERKIGYPTRPNFHHSTAFGMDAAGPLRKCARDERGVSGTFTTTLFYSIWTNDRFVFHPFRSIDLGRSFTDSPKSTTGCFDPPYFFSR